MAPTDLRTFIVLFIVQKSCCSPDFSTSNRSTLLSSPAIAGAWGIVRHPLRKYAPRNVPKMEETGPGHANLGASKLLLGAYSPPQKKRGGEDALLLGGFNPSENYLSKWESSPNRNENRKYFNPPPRRFSIWTGASLPLVAIAALEGIPFQPAVFNPASQWEQTSSLFLPGALYLPSRFGRTWSVQPGQRYPQEMSNTTF